MEFLSTLQVKFDRKCYEEGCSVVVVSALHTAVYEFSPFALSR